MCASIPLLRCARAVTIAALTGPGLTEEEFKGEQADLLGFLARHHVSRAS